MKFPKLFGGAESPEKKEEENEEVNNCPHLVLVARWDRVEDMGDESKAVGYRCYACGASLSLDEAREARSRSAIAL